MDCPCSLYSSTRGSVLHGIYHVYSISEDACYDSTDSEPHRHLQYKNGRWEAERDYWIGSQCCAHNRTWESILAVPLAGHHQLLVTCTYETDEEEREKYGVMEYWLHDTVSLDLVPLEYPTENRRRPLVDTGDELYYKAVVHLNPSTLLIIHTHYNMVVSLDPYTLSPECQPSMVGYRVWEQPDVDWEEFKRLWLEYM
ncbi:hypothetical protein KIPB_011921 [Kipferlia bialata]|uniref:Uncharacterized protein n=1 Tax=Kipferlia bialata TaxID=797122 RepID=A0A391NT39_9EUKA|nr:hypothetical protein KIPB_011921 [Kipferlia bialata]|eukprot:g11921.t1